jgi:hypothetical protein
VPWSLEELAGGAVPVMRLLRHRRCDPADAAAVRALCRTVPAVLPRWHQDDRGKQAAHRGVRVQAEPGAYSSIPAWQGRRHWLDVVVPAAIAAGREVLRRHGVAPDTLRAWAVVKSGYAHAGTGRRVMVRPDTLASVMDVTERQVQRCNRAARALGLEVVVLAGRMLDVEECRAARAAGSRQRGLATEVALSIPAAVRPAVAQVPRPRTPQNRSQNRRPASPVVDHVTPTRGGVVTHLRNLPAGLPRAGAAARGQEQEAASRPPHRRERRRPRFDPAAVHLAAELALIVPWLAGERPGRLAPTLTRFARCEPAWSAPDLAAAIGAQLRRAGRSWIDPEAITTRPAAVLAGILRQLDEQADNPAHADQWAAGDLDPAAAAVVEACGGRDCDGHGWITPPRGSTDAVRPCPQCPPAVRSARHRPGDEHDNGAAGWSAVDGTEPPF